MGTSWSCFSSPNPLSMLRKLNCDLGTRPDRSTFHNRWLDSRTRHKSSFPAISWILASNSISLRFPSDPEMTVSVFSWPMTILDHNGISSNLSRVKLPNSEGLIESHQFWHGQETCVGLNWRTNEPVDYPFTILAFIELSVSIETTCVYHTSRCLHSEVRGPRKGLSRKCQLFPLFTFISGYFGDLPKEMVS